MPPTNTSAERTAAPMSSRLSFPSSRASRASRVSPASVPASPVVLSL